jgi:arylsulfatase A-like enzyme
MKRARLLLVCFLLPLILHGQEPPNIIVFLVDDMGWQDTSLPFWTRKTELNMRYHTPNMERLAREGMRFTNAYATPVCTPTRTSLMTGMNAAHHHVTNWTHIQKNRSADFDDSQFNMTRWNHDGLSPRKDIANTTHATPVAQILKENGYFTIHAGKAHWGSMGSPGSNPHNLGFIVNIAGNATGHPQSFKGTENFGNMPGKTTFHAVQGLSEYYGEEIFLTEALTREALKALDAPIRNGQPFYLHMAHYAVHTPLQDDVRFYQKYLDAGLEEKEAKYASMIEGMDKSLGDIMDFLKEKKVETKTIIIFMSDNGGLSLTPLRGGKAHTHNLPLRAGKGSVYEGGIRVPMIVKWPGVVQPETSTDQYVIVEDFFPTILDMARIKDYRTVQTVDGKSFIPILKNPAYRDDSRALIWHYPNKWQPEDGPGINYKSAIRQGDWKLVYHLRSRQVELFNVKEDLGETNDVARQYPEKVKALASALASQLRKWKAPMPVEKASGRPVPFSDEL